MADRPKDDQERLERLRDRMHDVLDGLRKNLTLTKADCGALLGALDSAARREER